MQAGSLAASQGWLLTMVCATWVGTHAVHDTNK